MARQRYLLAVEYVGDAFSGWQAVPWMPSVQQVLETSLERLGDVQVVGSSRTDRGVHAWHNVCHVDLVSDVERPARSLRGCANQYLRRLKMQVQVLSAMKVSEDVHARFSARERTYVYRIRHGTDQVSVFEHGKVWHVRRQLDVEKMQQAAKAMKGRRDFGRWRGAGCQASSSLRTLDEFCVHRDGHGSDTLLSVNARAKSFLYKQVRMMVATLVACGQGSIQVQDIEAMLQDKDYPIVLPKQIAPPHGLYLADVKYDFPILNE
mmetsp:Transcript_5015/g.31949  ORF Transcript_5015/g.31949 Transcript_5015/m.31949 type:complete len:264 (-) Transcript_5015:2412-3203(-)